MFSYREFDTISYDNMRLYVIDGEYYPSITTVLGKTISKEKMDSLENWKLSIGEENANEIVNEAARNGTNVHLLIERFLMGEDLRPDEFTKEQINGFNSLKINLSKISEVWGQEVPLYTKVLGIAGRCDCIGVYEGRPSIIDFKTSRKIKKEDDIEDYFLQLTAYATMHNEMFSTNIKHGVILMSSALGFPQVFKKELSFYYDKLKNRVNSFYQLI
jgi:genome maintenance exonuclease 1